MRDIFTDLTNLIHPEGPELALDLQARNDREQFERDLRLAWEQDEDDPLLGQIAAARRAMLDAEKQLRLLVAYGREFVAPAPTSSTTWPKPPACPSPGTHRLRR